MLESKSLICSPQWNKKVVRLYETDPERELREVIDIRRLSKKQRYKIKKNIDQQLISYNIGKRALELLLYSDINDKRILKFIEKGNETIEINHIPNQYKYRDNIIVLEYYDIREPIISFLRQSEIKIKQSYNCQSWKGDVKEELISELTELFNNISSKAKQDSFERYIESWAKRLAKSVVERV